MKQPSLDALTSLRFFASAAIVLFHMQGSFIPSWYAPSLALGVSFFFVLSGFILTYSYSERFELRRFYVSRFARLWPVHIATLLLAIPVADQAGVIPSLTNVLLLQAWIPVVGYVFSLNAVSWSISAEVLFYVLFPVLRGRLLIPIISATAALTFCVLLALDIFAEQIWPPITPPIGQFYSAYVVLQFPLMRLLEFCVGIAAGRMFNKSKLETTTWHEVVGVAAVLIFALISQPLRSFISNQGYSHIGLWLSQSGGMLFFASAIYVFAHQRGVVTRLLQWRPLVFLGEISFSTYMLHQVVSRGLIAANLNDIALYILVTYSGAFLLHRHVEVWGKKKLEIALSRPHHFGSKAGPVNRVGIERLPPLNVQSDRLASNATDLN